MISENIPKWNQTKYEISEYLFLKIASKGPKFRFDTPYIILLTLLGITLYDLFSGTRIYFNITLWIDRKELNNFSKYQMTILTCSHINPTLSGHFPFGPQPSCFLRSWENNYNGLFP